MSVRPPVLLRAAAPADVPAIAAIYAHHVTTGTASFELDAPTTDAMAQRYAAITAAGYPYLVAVDARSRIVGYAYASAYRTRAAYRYTVEDSIYVASDAARHGIGARLLDALIEACTARGDRQMIAIIGGADNVPSIALHSRAGFVEAGRLRGVGRKLDRWIDSVLMQRPLGDGSVSDPPPRAGRAAN